MDNKRYAYIDECGGFGYDFENKGTSKYFIITAVVILENDKTEIERKLEEISKQYFGGMEIKSSRIGNDYIKRIQILKQIKDLKFDVISYAINKKEIDLKKAKGLGFKESFIKFTNRQLHKELVSLYDYLEIYSDEHGSDKFMEKFSEYFYKNEMLLLKRHHFYFANSKENVFIQLADFISGTIAYKYEDRECKDKWSVFYNFLRNRTIKLEEWPHKYDEYYKNLEYLEKGKYDEVIAKHCIEASAKYVENDNTYLTDVEKDQIEVIKILLYNLRYEDEAKYYKSHEIREKLFRITNREYSNHQFRSQIIAKLRDRGLIIASSSNGYKIPVSEKELYSYTNNTVQVVHPMLDRLSICRKKIKEVTKNELDILDDISYKDIKDYFDYIKNNKE